MVAKGKDGGNEDDEDEDGSDSVLLIKSDKPKTIKTKLQA